MLRFLFRRDLTESNVSRFVRHFSLEANSVQKKQVPVSCNDSEDNSKVLIRFPSKFYQHSFDSFESMIAKEKSDAKSYILIEDKTNGKLDSIPKEALEKILDSSITQMYKYHLGSRGYCLVKLDDYENFADRNNKNFQHQSFPVYARMFSLLPNSLKLIKDELSTEPVVIPDLLRNRKCWLKFIHEKNNMDSNEFIDNLVNSVLLNEVEAKLRFFLINQFEELLCTGPFNRCQVYPFGSSVNGFGWNQSDIDLFLTPETLKSPKDNAYGLTSASSQNIAGDNNDTKRVLQMLHGIINEFVPAVKDVNAILMARVPIIKFDSIASGLNVDLSFFLDSRDSGIDIAHVLYEYSRLDVRVVKLMIFVKLWAMQQGITRSAPGVWINSFGLMMLVVHFLQVRSPPLLPPISHLNVIYDPYQASVTKQTNDLCYDYKTPFMTLLKEFFDHYARFEFENYGCNVSDGLLIKKPSSNSALYIQNPTHRYLNVSKNVQNTELAKLVLIARASHDIISRGDHVSSLLKPFSRKSINIGDLY
ncbi:poly(A) RNA polymerase, mitochondrial [Tetranychus urticae]|uniref:Poly(A) RNA polymerase mitochondrial-like central palm domain-containing protein n=1 Tax=Tetranychus urticae TaxID=32264 RepID=T1KXS9_TETUR|nr:poly(A) RNA polymerase, mitochondrial [Tetranychus urticae]